MKKVLITGRNSYIGTSVENWLMKEPDNFYIDTIDMKDGSWKEKDFSKYDVVFHVAGIAHIKETSENQGLYYKVNRDLAYETAKKAKEEGVNQFIFLSSMSVYGIKTGVIDENTPLKPKSAYGKSKVEAEELINQLKSATFLVAILRPPMVYGKACKGNYSKLANLAKRTPIFPKTDNKRSMIFIDNFSEFLKQIINSNFEGIFFPQNDELVNTSEMVKLIASNHSRRIKLSKTIYQMIKRVPLPIVDKVFGSLYYNQALVSNELKYNVVTFEESIIQTERWK